MLDLRTNVTSLAKSAAEPIGPTMSISTSLLDSEMASLPLKFNTLEPDSKSATSFIV